MKAKHLIYAIFDVANKKNLKTGIKNHRARSKVFYNCGQIYTKGIMDVKNRSLSSCGGGVTGRQLAYHKRNQHKRVFVCFCYATPSLRHGCKRNIRNSKNKRIVIVCGNGNLIDYP